jgi:hypothetical protein
MDAFRELVRWLHVTDQQYEILKTINLLNNLRIKATPATIDRKYSEIYNHTINKSNLFRQLKRLTNDSLLCKAEKLNYCLDMEGINAILAKKQVSLNQELSDLKGFNENLKQQFRSMTESASTLIKYLPDAKEFFDEVNKYLINADTVYIVSPFANISFTPMVSMKASRYKYSEILKNRCFHEKTLRIKYLTRLDLIVPYTHAFNKYKNKVSSRKECQLIIRNLSRIVKTQDFIEMYYLENPFGFDFLMPIKNDEPKHVFLYIRDTNNIIVGGIYIRSGEIAQKAKAHFLNECGQAVNLRSRRGSRLLQNLFSELNNVS